MSALPKITDQDVLLIIDVQNDFCPGGALAVADGDAVVPKVNQLATQFSNVVITQDWHPSGHSSFASSHEGHDPFTMTDMPYGAQTLWPDHCIQGSRGAELHAELDVAGAQMIVRKGYRPQIDSYSAFFENDHTTPTGLTGFLKDRGLGRVFCTGLALDFCVRFSAEDAVAQGFETFVITDATRAIDLDGSLDAAMTGMKQAGVTLI